MSIRAVLLLACFAITASPATTGHMVDAAIHAAVTNPQRAPANVARDRYRHPEQTLRFFHIRPTMTVVEIWPTAGWYAEILAPLLYDRGHYVAALQANPKYREPSLKLFASDPTRFGRTLVATFDPKQPTDLVPPGSADAILSFRNIHNLVMDGNDEAPRAFAVFYRALKAGGILGIEDHHLSEDRDSALERTSGYLKRSTVVRLARQAGFVLAAESRINANPKDTADWPKGVWTLPPTLIQGDLDRARYLAIGESNRMTLRFIKPRH